MILKHSEFSKLVRDPKWMADYVCTIFDEAHCITSWGKAFRKDFADVDKIRSFMSNDKPFLIASATLLPAILDQTLEKLEFQRDNMFMLNLGNFRTNITQLMCQIESSINDLNILNWAVDEAQDGRELSRTIIYTNTRDAAALIYEHLLTKVPDAYKHQIDFIHARRSGRARERVMRRFREGGIKILCATEVAGMVIKRKAHC